MNRPLFNRYLTLLAVLAMAIYYVWPPSKQITLGLDLQGGTAYTLKLDLSQIESYQRESARSKAMEVLRKRLDASGLGEIVIQPVGVDRIRVEIPGLSQEKKTSTREQLQRVAYLEFRMVHPRNEEEILKMTSPKASPPAGYQLMLLEEKKRKSGVSEEKLLIKVKPELVGKQIIRAVAMQNPGGYEVSFELSSDGGEIFRKVTRENIGHRLAIVLDGKLISAPTINGEIGAHGQITGNFDYVEASDLASALENPLDTPVQVIEERGVDPTLGADSVKSGITAGVIGLSLVVLFMAVYYLRAGLVANVALLVNIVLLFGALVIFKFTLTLPGIAGIILTVGIAVDANVLIYERIREELRKGKPLVAAIDAGFDRAFGTIIDANVTTLITALVLAKLGTGPVQGFGYTLSVGIITSVFSAVFVSRLMFDTMMRYAPFEKMTMLSMVKQTNFNFLGFKWPAIAISGALIIAGALVAYHQGDEKYGIDFKGGDSLTLKFSQRVDVSSLRKVMDEAGMKEGTIQYENDIQGGNEALQIKVPFEQGEKVDALLKKSFPQAGFKQIALDKVGGTVGRELQWTAITGLFWATVGILIYITIRFEFAYAVGAIIALLHDVLICLAFYFFTGGQLSLTVVGALLTIAGYSLNDTIVVFDRIREEFKLKGEKFGFINLINLSVNETLSRTLLTSLTTFIASLSLFVFGGGVIHDFAFILVVGVITGTYSSVFIASPVLLLWHPSKLAPTQDKDGIGAQRQIG